MSAIDRPTSTRPDRVCDACGYSLAGLAPDAVCPECGTAARGASPVSVRDATMSAEAPVWFVKRLRLGVALCLVTIVGISGSLVAYTLFSLAGASVWLARAAVLVLLVAVGSWPCGVWLVSSARRGIGDVARDAVLDNDKLRGVTRVLAIAFPVAVGLGVIVNAAGVTHALLSGLVDLVWVASWIGLIPLSVYLSSLAYWASDHTAANKLQGTAWVMCAAGIARALAEILARTSLPIAGFSNIVAFWMGIILFFAMMFLLLQILRLGSSIAWVIKHQEARAGSLERVRRRIRDRASSPNRVVDMSCNGCGYELSGLPLGGVCPECGESYADRTGRPIRDPARDRVRRDTSDIPIEGLEFDPDRDAPEPRVAPPVEPEIEVPEEGDIPLAGDDDTMER